MADEQLKLEFESETTENNVKTDDLKQDNNKLKFIIIGGNCPELNSTILDSVNKFPEVKIYELENDEMNAIVSLRAKKVSEEIALNYVEDPSNKLRIQEWVKMINLRAVEVRYKHQKKESVKMSDLVLLGKYKPVMNRKNLKDYSGLSWKQSEELFNTLDLFGVVSYSEDKKTFSLTMQESDVKENRKNEVIDFLKLSSTKLCNYMNLLDVNSEDEKNILKELKRKNNSLNKLIKSIEDNDNN